VKATEVTAGLEESNGSLLPVLWRDSLHVTCELTACTPGSAPGPRLCNEYGKTLPFYLEANAKDNGEPKFRTSSVTPPKLMNQLGYRFNYHYVFRRVDVRIRCEATRPLQVATLWMRENRSAFSC